MYLVVFFLLLWTLFQGILCENCKIQNPDQNRLYILSTPDGINDNLMKTLLWHFSPKSIKTNCSGRLQDALRDTKNLRYVIYYGITDFYKNNYNDVRNSNMKWAGDYGKNSITPVCKSDASNDRSPIPEIREGRATETCSSFNAQKIQYTMLTSKYINAEENPELYTLNIIHRNELSQIDVKRSKINEFIIILCKDDINMNDPDKIQSKDTIIHIQYFELDQCKNNIPHLSNLIAIIAPGPEYIDKSDYYADKPIIFYDTMNNRQVVDMYKNAIIRKTELKAEVKTLLNLISQRWKRVAILSDGSAESGVYEKEVRTLFELKEISYTVKSAEGQSDCDFNEALSSLQSVDARIIIANVDEKCTDSLVEQAQKKGMTRKHNVIWIARAWSKAACLRAAKDLGTILTVTVEPNPDDAITVIKRLFEQDYEYGGFRTEAKFAQDIRKNYIKYKAVFQVVKTESDAVRNMPSDRGECTLKSDNFDRPCDDMVGILIALVIVVLAVTVLAITYFFDEPNMPYNRMVN